MSDEDRQIAEVMNQTFHRLSESIAQQSAFSINAINLPEFSGGPKEDIHQFLKEFKAQTSTLSDEHKCRSLAKVLRGPAAIWAKSNIKELLLHNNWKEVKAAMVSRYSLLDKQARYRQRLNQLAFNDKAYTLLSYVETYVSVYKKAFPTHRPCDIVQQIRWSLPDKIIYGLNLIDDKWVKYDSLPMLYDIVQRYEKNIIPFESQQESEGNALNAEAIQNMLREFKESIIKEFHNRN